MTGLFKVQFFDPKCGSSNVDSCTVIAANAEEAIRKANRLKLVKGYKVELVDCLGWSDK